MYIILFHIQSWFHGTYYVLRSPSIKPPNIGKGRNIFLFFEGLNLAKYLIA